jgi:diacylglycerol O-acyltransferase-1
MDRSALTTGLDVPMPKARSRSRNRNRSGHGSRPKSADGRGLALNGLTPRSANGASAPRQGKTRAEAGTQTAASGAAAAAGWGSKYKHVAAIHHTARPSVLSHDSQTAPSFLGFRNLMVIVLVAGNLRLVIENMQKYGVLISLSAHDFRKQDMLLGLGLYVLIPVSLFIAFLIERAAAHQALKALRFRAHNKAKASNSTSTKAESVSGMPTEEERRKFLAMWQLIAWGHGVNVTLALVVTTYVVYYHIHHPLIGTLTEMHAVIVWLKTASYALTNRDLRHAFLHSPSDPHSIHNNNNNHNDDPVLIPALYAQCPYPKNISVSNLCYFWWAPTLVYQPAYPRSPRVRWSFVAKRMGEVIILSAFIWFASAQYAAPVLRNSLAKVHSLDVASIIERLLKLSTVSLVIWLAGFFALFQSFLNALAEILCFGDRAFYDDWWNSNSLGAYWRTWNKPVYQFFKRHVYTPLVGRGWGQTSTQLIVFLMSAVLHEVLVGVPTHNVIGVAFMGMVAQLPLIWLTRPIERMGSKTGRMVGNCIFWISFTVVGQPLAALLYFYAWQAKYGTVGDGR